MEQNGLSITTQTNCKKVDKQTILQAANSFLYSDSSAWIKKKGDTFDITMGGFHGAEVCDLVGLYLLSQLVQVLPKGWIGLYRDDRLAVSSASRRQNDIMKKEICRIFEQNGLSITIQANCKKVHFLDITMELDTGIYHPYMKENDHPVYVNTCSNHPPMVLKNIPMGVNRRLSNISSSKEVFDTFKTPYQEALNKSGHKHTLEYTPTKELTTRRKNRRKKETVFNHPFSLNVVSRARISYICWIPASPPDNPFISCSQDRQ